MSDRHSLPLHPAGAPHPPRPPGGGDGGPTPAHGRAAGEPPASAPFCIPDPLTGRCATCADEGVEGRVLVLRAGEIAEVEMEGGVREVAMDLLDRVSVGDRVLVHAGVAIARLGTADG